VRKPRFCEEKLIHPESGVIACNWRIQDHHLRSTIFYMVRSVWVAKRELGQILIATQCTDLIL
jgi:hypothetical protein